MKEEVWFFAEKDGYFYNAKFVGSQLNKLNFTKIKMIEKVLTGTFQSDQGGVVMIENGSSVNFPADGIRQEAGGSYSGTVNVYATWLDPTAPDLTQRMPGDLRAMNAQEEQVQLTTYGMIGVELEGDAGEALNLADGQTAVIEVPVPSELLANAPATIPLWYFNKSSGYWEEEGTATLEGDKYVGMVSHFSFWNCDDPNFFVYIDGLITDEGIGIQGLLVEITLASNGLSASGYTDQDGLYSGYVPKDEPLIMMIFNACGEEIHSENIGPFNVNTTLMPVNVNGNTNTLSITGNVVDCNNEPVTNGYVLVYVGTQYNFLQLDNNGSISSTINICDVTSISIKAHDLDDLKQSELVVHDVSGLDNLDLGEITACEDYDEYLNFSINGVSNNAVIDPVGTVQDPNTTSIWGTGIDGSITFELLVLTDQPGDFNPARLHMTTSDSLLFYLAECEDPNCGDVNVNITTFEDIGGYIIGSLSGEILSGGPPIIVEADFKVTRQ